MEYSREELAREYGKLLPHLKQMNRLETEMRNIKIPKIPDEKAIQNAQNAMKTGKKIFMVGCVVLVASVILVLFIIAFIFLILMSGAVKLISLLLSLLPMTIGLMTTIIFGACLAIVIGMVCWLTTKNPETIARLKKEAAQKKTFLEADKKKYADELTIISQTIGIVPPNYRYEIAIEFMYNCFANERADTVKEAVNLYEEQLHRWKMENIAQQNLRIQAQQASYLNSIKNSTSSIANTTRDIYVAVNCNAALDRILNNRG